MKETATTTRSIMLIILVGPKGSGKSHIGRILERRLGIRFFHVEPLWMEYYADCRKAGREPVIAEGIEIVHPRIARALDAGGHVCVETTGASPEILNGLLSLTDVSETLVVRITAPLELCLERIAARDRTEQIPMDAASIRTVYDLSIAAAVKTNLLLDNRNLSEEEIVTNIENVLSA